MLLPVFKAKLNGLTHFWPMFLFCIPWKQQEILWFLVFSGSKITLDLDLWFAYAYNIAKIFLVEQGRSKIIIIIIIIIMSRAACGALAFNEHRYSKSPDLCTLIISYGYQ